MSKSIKKSLKIKGFNLDQNNASSLKEENEYLKSLIAEIVEKNKKLISKLKDSRNKMDLLKKTNHEKILNENEFLRKQIDKIQTELINIRKQIPIKNYNNVPIMGLENIGNSCFMNSVLQCLIHTEGLSNHFLGSDFKDLLKNSDLKLANKYHEILQKIDSNNKILRLNLSELHDIVGSHYKKKVIFIFYNNTGHFNSLYLILKKMLKSFY